MYKLTNEWQDNLEFQLYEIEFLECLMDTYFVKLLVQENLDELRELHIELFQAKKKSKKFLNRINNHINLIKAMLTETFKYGNSVFRVEHEALEDDISEFIAHQKIAKFIILKMTKAILENEKPKFIWKYN